MKNFLITSTISLQAEDRDKAWEIVSKEPTLLLENAECEEDYNCVDCCDTQYIEVKGEMELCKCQRKEVAK